MAKPLYGWWSDKMAQSGNRCIYRKENGAEVLVTNVTSTPDHGTLHNDIKLVAMVTQFVRSVNGPGGSLIITV